jgi:hypothetical protein
MTRRLALLTSSALTVCVLILAAGIAVRTQAVGSDAAPADFTDQPAIGPAGRLLADQSESGAPPVEDGGRPRGRLAAHPAALASALATSSPAKATGPASQSPRLVGQAPADGDGRSLEPHKERRAQVTRERVAGQGDASTGEMRSGRHASTGDRND